MKTGIGTRIRVAQHRALQCKSHQPAPTRREHAAIHKRLPGARAPNQIRILCRPAVDQMSAAAPSYGESPVAWPTSGAMYEMVPTFLVRGCECCEKSFDIPKSVICPAAITEEGLAVHARGHDFQRS